MRVGWERGASTQAWEPHLTKGNHPMTTSSLTLDQLTDQLRKPFSPDLIKFLPKTPQQREGKWFCLALPYADKRVYEDRLNRLAPGQWQTPPITALVAGNKLIVFSTVILCGIAHTDIGEAFLESRSRKGETREEENTATDAYAQAFKRACAQFGLGRYLYNLPKVWLPYDPEKRLIALSSNDLRETAERLYRKAGLLPANPEQGKPAAPSSQPPGAGHVASTRAAAPAPASPSASPAPASPPVHSAEEKYITPDELAWVRKALGDDPRRIANVCRHYGVETLEHLSGDQAGDLIWKHLVKQEMSRTPPPSTPTGQAQTSGKAAAQ